MNPFKSLVDGITGLFNSDQGGDRTYHVYVIELSEEALQTRTFRNRGLTRKPGKDVLYVGMTALSPEERFENHKAGHRSSKVVTNHGIKLRPDLYDKYNPLTRDDAKLMEEKLATKLRKKGHAVHWA